MMYNIVVCMVKQKWYLIRISEETHENLLDVTIRRESFDETIQRMIKTQFVINEHGKVE